MTENIIDAPEKIDLKKFRLKLIPVWIKIFCWIFLIFGAMTPIILVAPLVYNEPMDLEVLGFKANSPYETDGVIIVVFFILCGITSYGLLWAKNWGPQVGFIVGLIGLIIVIVNAFFNSFDTTPLELLLQIPFINKMHKIKDPWRKVEEEIL